jgi:alpha-L-fucosidase 2
MGGTWMSTHLWEHFLFTRDLGFLKNEAYPAMKNAALFCLQFLVKDKKGQLITSPSTSPENGFVTDKEFRGNVFYGGTADLSMIRELFSDVLDAQKILKHDEEFASKIESALANLHPYTIGKKGNLQEWYYDWEDQDPNHRHVSHLFGLYPGSSITMNKNPTLLKDNLHITRKYFHEIHSWTVEAFTKYGKPIFELRKFQTNYLNRVRIYQNSSCLISWKNTK